MAISPDQISFIKRVNTRKFLATIARDVAQSINGEIRYQTSALEGLHEAGYHFLLCQLENADVVTITATPQIQNFTNEAIRKGRTR